MLSAHLRHQGSRGGKNLESVFFAKLKHEAHHILGIDFQLRHDLQGGCPFLRSTKL